MGHPPVRSCAIHYPAMQPCDTVYSGLLRASRSKQMRGSLPSGRQIKDIKNGQGVSHNNYNKRTHRIQIEDCRILHNEELHNLHSSPNIGCFKKSSTTLRAYINLFKGYAQCFELSWCCRIHQALSRIDMVQYYW
jgi:hypothetical protein